MINITELKTDLENLPEEAQLLLIDFLEILKKRYTKPSQIDTKLEDEPFVGMWKEREEMNDSSQWVREVRKQQWRVYNEDQDSN